MSASASFYEAKVVAPQIDFMMRRTVAPVYKMLKIPLNNISSSSVTLAPGTTTILEWKLPTKVYNLARSYISATVTAPAVAARYNWMYEDTFDLGNNITFGSSQGVDLVNLSFANNYVKIARRIDTKLEDYLGNDKTSGLYKCNAAVDGNKVPANNLPCSDNFVETKYASQGGLAASLVNYRNYPLSAFTGTLLGVDRDIYFPVEQYLRVTAGTPDKTTWSAGAVDDPTNTPAVNPGGVTYSNLYLYLCVEQNTEIILGMLQKYESRQLIFRIPFTSAFRTVGTTTGGSVTNVTLNFPQQYGKRLKRIIHVAFHPVETLNTAFDCDNTGGKKIISYQTYLDSQQIQDHPLTCAVSANGLGNYEDWMENKKHCDKSVYTSRENYQRNWFHVDQFFEPRDKDSQLPEVNVDEGLIMDSSKQWVFSCTVGAGATGAPGGQGLVHFTFAEFQREVAITEMGGVFV